MTFDFPIRKIIHVDMDAFYASVEQLDNPELRGKPVAVGGSGTRGVISAASYEARKFGIKSAMSGTLARKYCSDLIFVSPRFSRYKEISSQIRKIFLEYTDLVEPLSLDEAYLDVTKNKKGLESATLLAQDIREKIFKKTGLTASAGISINKFVAKVASDYNKPNGQKTVEPHEVISFLENLEIRKFYGVGKVTCEKMYKLGIFTGFDLKQKSSEFLESNFGKSGSYYYNIVRGIHLSSVKPTRVQKSIAAERTFSDNLTSEVFLEDKLIQVANELEKRLSKSKIAGKTITLKLKYSDFTVQTRSKTLKYYISDRDLILDVGKELLYQNRLKNSVRLIGLSLSNLNTQVNNSNPLNKKSLSVQLQFKFK